jgi:peptidoglycan/xylan/chitin deacetylase (PgdA/CDA1 family)
MASHEFLFQIGSHTVTHSNLTSISGEQLKEELVTSKKQLEDILNKKIDWLAAPYGEYNQELCEIAREVGYKKIFSANPNFCQNPIDTFVSGRIEVSPNDSLFVYRLKLLGAYQWLPIAVSLKRNFFKFVGLSRSL